MTCQKKMIFLAAVIVAAGIASSVCYSVFHEKIDEVRILQNSLMKEKTFANKPQELYTPSGLKFWLMEEHSNPIISISFAFKKAGRAYDAEGQKGIAGIMARLLRYGAGKYDYEAFSEELEANAVTLNFAAEMENFTGLLVTPSENQETAYNLLRLALISPHFEEKYVNTVVLSSVVLLDSQTEEPGKELALKVDEYIFGNHPYGENPIGRKEDLLKLTSADLRAHLHKSLARDTLIVGVAGDITPDEAIKTVEKIFTGLPEKNLNQPVAAPVLYLPAERISLPRAAAQVTSKFVAHGAPRMAEDFYPLYIANHIFGASGLTSRLSIRAREKGGLTYGISTGLVVDEKRPMIIGSFSATKENYPDVMKILQEEWHKMATEGVTEEELKAAKNNLLASFNLRFKTVSSLAKMLTALQDTNLEIDFLQKRNDYIRAVTREEVNRAAARYFADEPFEMHIGLDNL